MAGLDPDLEPELPEQLWQVSRDKKVHVHNLELDGQYRQLFSVYLIDSCEIITNRQQRCVGNSHKNHKVLFIFKPGIQLKVIKIDFFEPWWYFQGKSQRSGAEPHPPPHPLKERSAKSTTCFLDVAPYFTKRKNEKVPQHYAICSLLIYRGTVTSYSY